jgi:hypothetical protein
MSSTSDKRLDVNEGAAGAALRELDVPDDLGRRGTGVVTAVDAHRFLDAAAAGYAASLGTDGPARLRERAAILGIAPQGRVSAGGTCRLVRASDRWFALNLARGDDVGALAAWMGREWDGPVWDVVVAEARAMRAGPAVERAQLLGVPAAVAFAPDEYPVTDPSRQVPADGVAPTDDPAPAARRSASRLVVDLSSLWAGPLCARLLGDVLGATVVKVEHPRRPDGARAGSPQFWHRLNAGKQERTIDFSEPAGRRELDDLIDAATVVVTGARPRAFAQLGLDPRAASARGVVWVSITGYGYTGPWRDRVAFGDDAAVAGGLAVAGGSAGAPVFVGDAVADPLAGLAGAADALRRVEAGRAGFVDVSLAGVVNRALRRGYAARNRR